MEFDRETELQASLERFDCAEDEGLVMSSQTLGGQIVRHDGEGEEGKPHYFVGAFKGEQLHLTRVAGTAQMRPQFHHVDAETQRDKLLSSRAAAGDNSTAPSSAEVRAVNQRLRDAPSANPKGELEAREAEMDKALQDAREEQWTNMRFVDEDEEEAYEVWEERMFVGDTDGVERLKSVMDNDRYLDAISAPGRESPTRKRRRARAKKSSVEDGEEERDEEMGGA